MRGKIVLIPVDKPVEGMKVVAKHHNAKDLSIFEIVSVADNEVRVKQENFEQWTWTSTTKQIAIEYMTYHSADNRVEENGLKTLPLLSTDWEYAIKHIGEEVEWKDHTIIIPDKSFGPTQEYPVAKLIIPSPIMYTEEEAKEIAWKAKMFPNNWAKEGSLYNMFDHWWEQNKKK